MSSVLFLMNTSGVPIQRVGLLTDDYGIVTGSDLDEEENKCGTYIDPFPPPSDFTNHCTVYWQCLPIHDVFMNCNDLTDAGDFEQTGEADFWIRDNNQVHHYITRRNFDMESCWGWIDEWISVMWNEEIVCLSGDFVGTEEEINSHTGKKEIHNYWIIDRMKSRHAEWSYFVREEWGRHPDDDIPHPNLFYYE